MINNLRELPPPPPGKTGWPWTEETDPAIYDATVQWPRITIVTPSYNQGQFIEETIRSILLQNYPNLEYIVIDGGSTDEATAIIRKYERWLTYWVSEKDRGQSHAINKGMERATGEICNWINSDDCLSRNALKTISVGFADKNILCFCGFARVIFDDDIKDELFRTSLLDKDINTHLANCSFSQPATFFRMSGFREITPVEESLHMNMDMYMWYRFVCLHGLGRIKHTEEIICDVKAQKDAKTIKHFRKSFVDKQRIYDSLFVELNKKYKYHSDILPMPIADEIRKGINYRLLRMKYCRTHPWLTDFNGKIIKVNVGLMLEWFYRKIQTLSVNGKRRDSQQLTNKALK